MMRYFNLNPVRKRFSNGVNNAVGLLQGKSSTILKRKRQAGMNISNGVRIIGLVCLVLLVQSSIFKVQSIYSVRDGLSNGTRVVRGISFPQHSALEPTQEEIDWTKKHILPNKKEVNYREIIPTFIRLVFFGELHDDYSPKRELQENMDLFKEMGFTHLAMEVFKDNGIQQQVLDDYFEASEEKEIDYEPELREFIIDFLDWITEENLDIVEEYLDVVRQAKRQRIRIRAMNPAEHDLDKDMDMADVVRQLLSVIK